MGSSTLDLGQGLLVCSYGFCFAPFLFWRREGPDDPKQSIIIEGSKMYVFSVFDDLV